MSQTDVLCAAAPVAAATCVASLPNTGSNVYVTIALSLAAGLVTWAVIYKVRAAKQQ